MTFTVPADDISRATRALEAARQNAGLGFARIETNDDVAKVSIVGVGMRSHSGVAHRMFAALALISATGIAIYGLFTLLSNLALGRWHESAGRRER